MLGVKPTVYKRSVARSLGDLVPSDNFDRILNARLDLSVVRNLVQDHDAPVLGHPSIDPIGLGRAAVRRSQAVAWDDALSLTALMEGEH